MHISRKELRKYLRKRRHIEEKGQRKLMKDELKRIKAEYWPKRNRPSTAKMAMAYIFISCTVVQIYSMVAMWHFGDLSALYSLIGATVGEVGAYCAYAAKSAKENTKGGIVHDMALKSQEGATEASEQAQEEAKG